MILMFQYYLEVKLSMLGSAELPTLFRGLPILCSFTSRLLCKYIIITGFHDLWDCRGGGQTAISRLSKTIGHNETNQHLKGRLQLINIKFYLTFIISKCNFGSWGIADCCCLYNACSRTIHVLLPCMFYRTVMLLCIFDRSVGARHYSCSYFSWSHNTTCRTRLS